MKRPTVLISDDEPQVVAALAREAKRAGFAILTDTSSEQVLHLAQVYQPDLIVLDIHQKIDGRELLVKLRRDPKTRNIKIAVLSGVNDHFTQSMCAALGACVFISKPPSPSLMDDLMGLVSGPQTPAPQPTDVSNP